MKKGIFLFEVLVAALLVSIFSIFLFRGYSTFIRAGKKSADYVEMITLLEEKMWEIQAQDQANMITPDMQTDGELTDGFLWHLDCTKNQKHDLQTVRVRIQSKSQPTVSWDVLLNTAGAPNNKPQGKGN